MILRAGDWCKCGWNDLFLYHAALDLWESDLSLFHTPLKTSGWTLILDPGSVDAKLGNHHVQVLWQLEVRRWSWLIILWHLERRHTILYLNIRYSSLNGTCTYSNCTSIVDVDMCHVTCFRVILRNGVSKEQCDVGNYLSFAIWSTRRGNRRDGVLAMVVSLINWICLITRGRKSACIFWDLVRT